MPLTAYARLQQMRAEIARIQSGKLTQKQPAEIQATSRQQDSEPEAPANKRSEPFREQRISTPEGMRPSLG